jgi:uncharacterized protein YcbX
MSCSTVVSRLSITPVKGMRLRSVQQIQLGLTGARGDRRFFVIDERDRMISGKQLGELCTILADYSLAEDRLTLTFPDGSVVDGPIQTDGSLPVRFYSHTLEARLLAGPWSQALSAHASRTLRLVQAQAQGAVDRGRRGAATLISRASLTRLAQAAGQPQVDARRFRMLVEIDGVDAHAEDRWVGRTAQIGEAAVRFGGHVGRCLFTSRDPETGKVDLPTLEILRDYRGEVASTEPLPFGVYGEVVREGSVRIGDPVALEQ